MLSVALRGFPQPSPEICSRTTLPAVNRQAWRRRKDIPARRYGTQAGNQQISSAVHIEIELPDDLSLFRLPDSVQERLNTLLNKQDVGDLTDAERLEAEGLVDLADLLSLLRLRAERVSGRAG